MKYKDTAVFLLLLSVCFLGIIVGVVVAKRQQVDVSIISSSIAAVKSDQCSLNTVFLKGLLSNLYLFIMLSITGMLVFGFPISTALLFYKGYAVGFTCSCICMAMGFRGIAMAIVGVLFPSFVLLLIFCHMVYTSTERGDKRKSKLERKNKMRLVNGFIYVIIFIFGVYTQSLMQYIAFYKF